jgi:hypothetical protein
LDNNPIHIIAISKKIQGEYLLLKLIDFNENVGILLIIINPIINRFIILKYGSLKNKMSNSKTIKTGNNVNPAAPGDGTPMK